MMCSDKFKSKFRRGHNFVRPWVTLLILAEIGKFFHLSNMTIDDTSYKRSLSKLYNLQQTVSYGSCEQVYLTVYMQYLLVQLCINSGGPTERIY